MPDVEWSVFMACFTSSDFRTYIHRYYMALHWTVSSLPGNDVNSLSGSTVAHRKGREMRNDFL